LSGFNEDLLFKKQYFGNIPAESRLTQAVLKKTGGVTDETR